MEFDKVEEAKKIKKVLEMAAIEIPRTDISQKNSRFDGNLLGVGERILIRIQGDIDKGEKVEVKFISMRGIIRFPSTVEGRIENVFPPIYLLSFPERLEIFDRRKYPRVPIGRERAVIVKRESGYALLGNLIDISLGGFSVEMEIKDKFVEYLLPMIQEKVDFEIHLKKKVISGKASCRHYSLDSKGKYKGGFQFDDVPKSAISLIRRLYR